MHGRYCFIIDDYRMRLRHIRAAAQKTAVYDGAVASAFLCSCFYYAILGEWSGFICSAVAVLGFVIQASLPHLRKQKYAAHRAIVSVSVILFAVGFMYQSPADILPIIGFSCARLYEAQLDEHRLRFGYAVCGAFWFAYTVTIFNPVLMIAYFCIWASAIDAYVRHKPKKESVIHAYGG